jgi:uncharacterized cupin superfamily protein
MGVIDQSKCPVKTGSIYPEPYASMMAGRRSLRLGQAGGLTQIGANLVILDPGARSSLRHWHECEDEFVMVTEGEVVLLQDEGEYVLGPGDCAAFPAGDTNGHCFVNRTDREARFLVVGTKAPREVAHYSDEDFVMVIEGAEARMTYRDGAPWTGHRKLEG